MTLEWIGLLGSLALLIVLTMRGVDLLLAAPVCALLLALSFGLPLLPQLAGVRRGQLHRRLHDGLQRVHRLVVLRLPARLGLRQGDGGQRGGRQRRAVGRRAFRGATRAARSHRRLRHPHLRRREPVRGGVLGVPARACAVPRGRLAAAFHSRRHRLRLGHLHDDVRGLPGNPELDPDAVPGHDPLCRVAGQPRRRRAHGCHGLRLAQVDDRPLDHRGRTLRRA